MCSLIMDIGKPERSEPETPITQCRRPGPGDNHPFLLNPAMPGRTALCPAMSLAPAAVPTPSVLLSFGGGDHYSLYIDMSTSLGLGQSQ